MVSAAPKDETTEAGHQTLIEGVRPITLRERIGVLMALPIRPKRNPTTPQKPCDHGLFDEVGRAQIDLTDLIAQSIKETDP